MAWNPLPGITENLLAEAIVVALAGGGVIAWIRAKHPTWIPAICWGLGGAVVILIGAGAIRVIATPFQEQPQQVTAESIEPLMLAWLDHFRINVRNEPIDAAFFHRVATMRNGNQITVGRYKGSEHYIVLTAAISTTATEQALIDRLTATQMSVLMDDISIEAARTKTIFTSQRKPLSVTLEKRIPLTNSLTEDIFIGGLDGMDSVMLVLQETIVATLHRSGLLH